MGPDEVGDADGAFVDLGAYLEFGLGEDEVGEAVGWSMGSR
jgi:hypothetical protein